MVANTWNADEYDRASSRKSSLSPTETVEFLDWKREMLEACTLMRDSITTHLSRNSLKLRMDPGSKEKRMYAGYVDQHGYLYNNNFEWIHESRQCAIQHNQRVESGQDLN